VSAYVIEVIEATFASEVEQAHQPVFVDFWAPWCGPCRALAPLFNELAERYAGRIKFAKVNVDDNKELMQRMGVRGIPALLLYTNGKIVERLVGGGSKSRLIDILDRHATATGSPLMLASKTYRAFYGDPALRNTVVERVRQHIDAEQIAPAERLPICDEANGRYSLMGAALHSADLDRYEGTFGIPAELGTLEECVHNYFMQFVSDAQGKRFLFREQARDYPIDWLQSIPLGADLQSVTPRFLSWLLLDLIDMPQLRVSDDVKTVAREVAALHRRTAEGQPPSAQEWQAARAGAGKIVVTKDSADGPSFNVASCAEALAWPPQELNGAPMDTLWLAFPPLEEAGLRSLYSEAEWAHRKAVISAANQKWAAQAQIGAAAEQREPDEVTAYKELMKQNQEKESAQRLKSRDEFGERLHRGLMQSLAAITPASRTASGR
jgi:thioredoxin